MDVIRNNDTCGLGYEPPGGIAIDADVSFTLNPIVENNTVCSGPRGREGHHGGEGHHKNRPEGGWRAHSHR
jgi:hypothetical protein